MYVIKLHDRVFVKPYNTTDYVVDITGEYYAVEKEGNRGPIFWNLSISDLEPVDSKQKIATQKEAEYMTEGNAFQEVFTKADIERIYILTGEFHDNYVDVCEYADDVLRLKLYNPWGNDVEFLFSGDVAYYVDIGSLDDRGNRSWWKGTILITNSYFYLIDQPHAKIEDTNKSLCWCRGKHLRYRIIPASNTITP